LLVSAGGEGGIAFGVPEGCEPAATTRIELENPPACAGAVFYAQSLLKYISMRPGHKKTRPFGAGFQAQCLTFSGEGGIRTHVLYY
jgi:hypothetical protein